MPPRGWAQSLLDMLIRNSRTPRVLSSARTHAVVCPVDADQSDWEMTLPQRAGDLRDGVSRQQVPPKSRAKSRFLSHIRDDHGSRTAPKQPHAGVPVVHLDVAQRRNGEVTGERFGKARSIDGLRGRGIPPSARSLRVAFRIQSTARPQHAGASSSSSSMCAARSRAGRQPTVVSLLRRR